MSLYLPVLYGTVREGRKSIHVARFVAERLALRPDVETRLFDPRELPFDNLRAREWEMDPQPEDVRRFVEEMARADGFVIVTPEYNHSIPGALKNMLDALFDEWNRKPFGMVTAGGLSGGMRVADGLRQIIAGLDAIAVPSAVHVQRVGKTFDENGPKEDREAWEKRLDKFFSEVEWYAQALKVQREATPRA